MYCKWSTIIYILYIPHINDILLKYLLCVFWRYSDAYNQNIKIILGIFWEMQVRFIEEHNFHIPPIIFYLYYTIYK